MNNNLVVLQDVNKQPYLGINFDITVANNFVQTLISLDIIKSQDHKNLRERNGDYHPFHITILNVPEFSKVPYDFTLNGIDIDDITVKGCGSISKDDMTTYFIVVESLSINKFRNKYGFKDKDLHVTVAFTHKDLFHDRKNITNILTLH